MPDVAIRIPADFEPHARVVMAWAVHREWGGDRDRVERELETVIRTIAEDEPVTLLTPPDLLGAARIRFAEADVEIVPAPVDDIWMRDIAPVFAKRSTETIAIDFNFNGWDNSLRRPSRPGDRLARTFDFGLPVIGASFVGEGGAFLADGRGLVIATRSCLLARNPHLPEPVISAAFGSIGMHTTVWLDGDRDEPITSGHPDGYLAFAPDGTLLAEAIDRSRGRRKRERDLRVLTKAVASGLISGLRRMAPPEENRIATEPDGFVATYLNFFVTRRTVITARFGNPGDDAARRHLAELFPGRDIRMLGVDAILRGGGIRCLTQPVPT
ncbi:agmatine deiminase family protein [Bradyrhizobium sp. Arg62]|uniref:agmatine deiminase family protein n=1 Tax=Bradyrhizobium brasilense TaxID=1419277 RepID=UPI001E582C5C|nr:agmatine deiminase family protein [Bradyrhizobium brasilense]MCC8950412.1 agmatine deiminase family protein [Bradyrhizobium brasilense]